MKPRVIVTGGAGYLGTHVVRALIAHGAEVVVFARHSEALDGLVDRENIVADSVFDVSEAGWERIAGADALIHLAWRDGFALRSRAHGEDLSAHYAFLLGAAERGVSRIAPIGTMHEIGYWEGAIDEETPSAPSTPYGAAKVALRDLLRTSLPPESALAWLRCYYITGDDERSQSIFGKILAAEARGEETFPFTTGKNRYDFIDVDVLAEQIVSAALDTNATGIIECCSGAPVTLADAVERFIKDHGLRIRLAYGAFPDRPFDSPGLWGDASRIEEIIERQERSLPL